MKRTLREAADCTAAGLAWLIIIVAAFLLAALVGVFLAARAAWRVLLAWPGPVESRSEREARLLDPHEEWLRRPYDMDAELAALIAAEDARQRQFPADSGSVAGWGAVAGAILVGFVCLVAAFAALGVAW